VGVAYRFRYRARNAVGWSAFSAVSFITAAAPPGRPPAPTLQAASAASLTLSLAPSTDDGGQPITRHRIYRDSGAGLSSPPSYTTELAAYDGTSGSYATPTAGADALTPGATYRFVFAAESARGLSTFSEPLVAGVGAPRALTGPPVRVPAYDWYHAANKTVDMMVAWD
jgi:hypothetical protein